MTKLLYGSGLLAAIAIVACAPARPPVVVPALGPVTVVASTADGGPVAGARVAVNGVAGVTDASGRVSVRVLLPGRYEVTIDANGFRPYVGPYALTRETEPVAVTLTPDTAPPPTVPRPSPSDVLTYRGCLSNARDRAGRVIWSPALPGASPDTRREWLDALAACGATHVPIGPFLPGCVYTVRPGQCIAPWDNPDWTRDPEAIRGLVLDILNTRGPAGVGLVPVIFFDSGDANPGPRLSVIMPTLDRALDGLGQYAIGLPCGWESYDWLPRECYDADRAWPSRRQGLITAWHGWKNRSNGASNDPYNPNNTDPFLDPPQPDGARYGSGIRFWSMTSFEMFLYQTEPVRTIAEAGCGKVPFTNAAGKSGLAYPEECYKNRLQDAIARIGASFCSDDFGDGSPCGWPKRRFVVFETTAYYDSRDLSEPGVAAAVARAAQAICQQFGVSCGFGNGLP